MPSCNFPPNLERTKMNLSFTTNIEQSLHLPLIDLSARPISTADYFMRKFGTSYSNTNPKEQHPPVDERKYSGIIADHLIYMGYNQRYHRKLLSNALRSLVSNWPKHSSRPDHPSTVSTERETPSSPVYAEARYIQRILNSWQRRIDKNDKVMMKYSVLRG